VLFGSAPIKLDQDLEYSLGLIGFTLPWCVGVESNALNWMYRRRLAAFTAEHRLPMMGGLLRLMDMGGLMAYGTSLLERAYSIAALVDKILKGAKLADLAVTSWLEAVAPDQVVSGGKFRGQRISRGERKKGLSSDSPSSLPRVMLGELIEIAAALRQECRREDSNLHPVDPDQTLNLARLPIPPLRHGDLSCVQI
jgi:hypothetical protein